MKLSTLIPLAALLFSVDAAPVASLAAKVVGGALGGGHKRSEFDHYGLTARDLRARDLFAREPSYGRAIEGHLYARDLAYAQLYARAAVSAKTNDQNQITIPAVVDMIKNKQTFPAPLEAAIAASPLAGYSPPSGRKPCPAELKDHPASNAISILKSGNVPADIMAALKDPKNGWTTKAAAGGSSGGKPKASKRYAMPAAYYDEELSIYARNAHPEAFSQDYELTARDAYAEAYDEEVDVYARDAEAEANPETYDEYGYYL